jgi:ribA/ribD-fused uncharacterized protein
MTTTPIRFYNIGEQYGQFSNFALYSIRLKGKTWPTVEHYFQAQKFAGTPHEQTIRKAKTPMKAAELGRSRKHKIRKNWDKMRDNVMYDALYAKFTQYAELRALLLSTGDAALIEASPNDRYWGEGGDRKGTNRLGKLLVKLREKLQE